MRTVEIGTHDPLGATLTLEGTNFALYSATATEVSLVLFDRADGPPSASSRSGVPPGVCGTPS
jgi:pullulanase/glycogen debranching enzyme